MLFGALAADWLGAGADSFFADIEDITKTLRTPARMRRR